MNPESCGRAQLVIRVPRDLRRRLDDLAGRAGLSRSQFVRVLLDRATEADLPPGLVESADVLRAANRVAT